MNNSRTASALEERQSSVDRSIDTKLMRKLDCNQRTFTSQIDSIPGPKHTVIRKVGEQLDEKAKEEQKKNELKNMTKQYQHLGAFYQDSKYAGSFKPSRAYRTYIKSVKNEWNRDPGRPEAIAGRQRMLYNKTSIA